VTTGYRFQQKRGTSADWAARTTPLLDGEFGVDKDTGVIKIGDGLTMWQDLPPLMGSEYLPILGTAHDSNRLGGLTPDAYLHADAKAVDSDKLNGQNSSFYMPASAAGSFLPLMGKAADADLLDGHDSSFFMPVSSANQFLPVAGKAADADLLDGNDSTYFARASDVSLINRELAGRTLTAAASLTLADEKTLISSNQGPGATFTIPANSSVAFPIGGWFDIQNIFSTGTLAIVPAAGVTIRTPVSGVNLMCIQPYAPVRLLKVATDEWVPIAGTVDTGLQTVAGTAPWPGSISYRVKNGWCFFDYVGCMFRGFTSGIAYRHSSSRSTPDLRHVSPFRLGLCRHCQGNQPWLRWIAHCQ
jgi:hypothetical protein